MPEHTYFGYTSHGDYRCECGYPVSAPISPVAVNHPAGDNMILKIKQAWHDHKQRATNRDN